MRHLLGAVVLATAPLTAQAQSIDDAQLKMSFDRCVNSCGEGHAVAYCTEICGCMTGEMSRHWTRTDFETRIDKLRTSPQDESVRGELDRLAQYCADRIQ